MRPARKTVVDLGEKMDVLRRAAEPSQSAEAFRKFMGIRRESTLRYYISGSQTRPRETIPDSVFDRLVEFTKTLLTDLSRQEVVDLLEQQVEVLKEALHTRSNVTWLQILDKLGNRMGARAIRWVPPDFGMVELVGEEGELDEGTDRIMLNEWFELEFPILFSGYHIILEHAQGKWKGVRFASGRHMEAHGTGELVFPGADCERKKKWLREQTEIGKHRFVCVSARIPFPQATMEAIRHGLIEKAALDRLARFIHDQPASGRHLSILDISISDTSEAGA